ncbi:BP74-related protein [Leifsonia flava]|uniref:BP74 N-terminal domain-containing protein n=1 Tax=Orlajensenia leifsoniae TaxID=2561933 RepID=A0A4Y9R8D6_9MICO|nr:hypothetical protein [Leifsonia flava]TFV99923.1 hypothetical protein E4M00_01605 [Leifsonia flava]
MRASGLGRRIGISAIGGAFLLVMLAGCSGGSGGGTTVPSVATFEIEQQTFKIELATPELVQHAKALLAGEEVAAIPVGHIVRDDPSVNAPWSWHIDPATLEFADFTTEVCDGLPEYVEDGTLTSDIYCPWLAKVTSVQPIR